jgi:hypothetical protein
MQRFSSISISHVEFPPSLTVRELKALSGRGNFRINSLSVFERLQLLSGTPPQYSEIVSAAFGKAIYCPGSQADGIGFARSEWSWSLL